MPRMCASPAQRYWNSAAAAARPLQFRLGGAALSEERDINQHCRDLTGLRRQEQEVRVHPIAHEDPLRPRSWRLDPLGELRQGPRWSRGGRQRFELAAVLEVGEEEVLRLLEASLAARECLRVPEAPFTPLLDVGGEQRDRFADASAFQKYAGIAPVTERSGNKRWVHWRWSCPTFLRQTFVEWVACSVPRSFWTRAVYESHRAKGASHNATVRALAFKWTRILYRCWVDRTPYNESRYLDALQKRRSPLLKFAAQVPL
jgi:hypothetical protein